MPVATTIAAPFVVRWLTGGVLRWSGRSAVLGAGMVTLASRPFKD